MALDSLCFWENLIVPCNLLAIEDLEYYLTKIGATTKQEWLVILDDLCLRFEP